MLTENSFKALKVIGFTMTMSALACWTTTAVAADDIDHSKMDHSMMDHSQHSGDEHAQHRAMMNQEGYERKQASYQTPDVTLIDQNGKNISMVELLGGDDPLMLNFIFTSCTTICPVLTATFSQVQKEYGAELNGVKMISISIDPEYDTPARLKEYAQRFHAPDDWTFLTGDLEEVIEVMGAFDAYRGDKMNHIPLTFVRLSADTSWVRLEGFPGANDLLKEYKLMVSQNVNSQ